MIMRHELVCVYKFWKYTESRDVGKFILYKMYKNIIGRHYISNSTNFTYFSCAKPQII